ncbi:MAG: NACHT domain-containing protein [Anaerolineales bacterium]|nr:NACHT domain-containing protein [Anaerolineales bacterium]
MVAGDKVTHITHNYFRAPTWTEASHQRNRQVMLQSVRDFWVRGVLENSVFGAALMQLGLTDMPEAIEQPWHLILRRPDQADQVVRSSPNLLGIFDEANGALLILGTPGAGKTTSLLELARALLRRAEQDATAPVPAVLSLSTWAEARLPLGDWLVDELAKRYAVPRKVGRAWIQQDMILPLLDGLDEVKAAAREQCLQAINTFRAEHGLMPLVVCSRAADYAALSARLQLRAAVVLAPLTPAQVDQQLARLGLGGARLRLLLQMDEELRKLAETPLMLSIMLAALGEAAEPERTTGQPLAGRRSQLFERYVEKMLDRQPELRVYAPAQAQPEAPFQHRAPGYSRPDTRHWLTWLAQQLQQHNQSVFYLEWMQPSWLPGVWGPRIAVWGLAALLATVLALTAGLGLGLLSGLVAEWAVGRSGGRVVGLAVGLGVAACGSLIGGLAGWRILLAGEIQMTEALVFSLPPKSRRFLLTAGPVIWLVSGLLGGWLLAYGPASGLLNGMFAGPAGMALLLLGNALGIGLAVLSAGLKGSPITIRKTPNQGMWQSLRSGLIGGLIFGLIGALFGGLAPVAGFGTNSPLSSGALARLPLWISLAGGLFFGLIGGWAGALSCGWRAGLQHAALRLLLWRNGSTPPPWEYVRFLDYAAERVLLRKVGGGYIFIHRTLLEWFAEQSAQAQ